MKSAKACGVCPDTPYSETAAGSGPVFEADRWLLRSFLKGMGAPRIGVRLWDGEWASGGAEAAHQLVIRSRRSLWRLVVNPLLCFGDDFSAGTLEVEGDLVGFLEEVYRALAQPGEVRRRYGRLSRLSRSWWGNTLSGSRENIQHHYDLGNDFYRLWLDDEMLYTCAYFPTPSVTLEQAQGAKMELICRKLRLKGGERVVEAGCGWGGLARYMAKNYGARVRAFNISGEQVAYARERARREGITGVEYLEDDYRNIAGECDAFVSVGMLEHVGPSNYRRLGGVIDRVLSRNGVGLIHTIGQDVAQPMSDWLEKRIFPGSYTPTPREMMEIFEPWGLSVLDLENLRLHYANTLRHWLRRFEAHQAEVETTFDTNFVRAWRLYLCGSIASFETGTLQLYQVLFSRQGNNELPWTRQHLMDPGSRHGTV